jgi:hypothetical protein
MLAVAVGVAACGSGSPPPGPYDVVSNYLSQVAEGNYGNACGLLDSRTRQALVRRMGSRTPCSHLFRRCLPNQATKISHDQTQLLYANIQVISHRNKADVKVGGTTVARAIREVTAAKEHKTWKLTSYGEALQRCPAKARRLRASRRTPAVG